jgi:hypothetical protein
MFLCCCDLETENASFDKLNCSTRRLIASGGRIRADGGAVGLCVLKSAVRSRGIHPTHLATRDLSFLQLFISSMFRHSKR